MRLPSDARAVDTNVVIRLLTRDEPRQTARAEAFVSKGAWVSHIVLFDVVGSWTHARLRHTECPHWPGRARRRCP
jgi:hypothetical protein